MDLGKETPLDLSKRLEVHNRQESLKGPFKIVHLTARIDCIPPSKRGIKCMQKECKSSQHHH